MTDRPPLGPLLPDPGTARSWLAQELARPAYQPSLGQRVVQWLDHLLHWLFGSTQGVGTLPPFVSVVLLVLVGVLAAFLLSRLRTERRPPGTAPELFTQGPLTASDHRRRAAEARSREEWDTAVAESLRALATRLSERELLELTPGLTARECTDRAAALFPPSRGALDAGVRAFEASRYGDRAASAHDAAGLAALEEQLWRATPEDTRRSPAPAAPR